MPNILKRFMKSQAEDYQFHNMEETASTLQEMVRMQESIAGEDKDKPDPAGAEAPPRIDADPSPPPAGAIEFARAQADAIVRDAEERAAAILDQAKLAAEAEVSRIHSEAADAGFQEGFSRGQEQGRQQAVEQTRAHSQAAVKELEKFLREAADMRDSMIDRLRGDLLDVAVTVAEKVIRVSLKSSEDIIQRMVISATEKLKKREWVRIYIADCDMSGMVSADPALTAVLSGLSAQVKIVPMQEAESGTCVIEMPDQIIDVSASTQVDNIRTIIRGTRP